MKQKSFLYTIILCALLLTTVKADINLQTKNSEGSSLSESRALQVGENQIPAKSMTPSLSIARGFFSESFDAVITSHLAGGVIKYTLDGSDPTTSPNTIVKTSPATITIDPESSEGQRGKTPGVVLRACAQDADHSESDVVTHTYLFVNRVSDLSPDGKKPGPGWPAPTRSGQWKVYGMDRDVTNDNRYKDLIDDALLAIPTISLATDLKNLFDPDSGIYEHANEHGIDWERKTSVELLNPDGSPGFQVNAGLRIRGGWSRHPYNPKHAFRLFFRKEYGAGKLQYPLFGDEGADQFDKIDLRTSQNYSWSYDGGFNKYCTMTRDVFSRDLQREMSQPYTRSRYYHLYINGVYWGLFQTQERAEASFAETYLGGAKESYDVIKPNIDSDYHGTGVEATDGVLDSWQKVWSIIRRNDYGSNKTYFRLQGRNEDGAVNPHYPNLVDMDNLIDYMLIIFYAGNFDSPTNVWSKNRAPKNFFLIYNRTSPDGYKFMIHDAEHSLNTMADAGPGTVGLYENRVNIGFRDDNMKMVCSRFSDFHPQWLHFRLAANKEFRLRMADHIYKYFFNNGVMTPEKTTELFLSRAKEISTAIIAESARWGDTQHHPARTKDDDWQWAVDDIVNNYFPYRTNIVLEQLREVNWYPKIDPPLFKADDSEIKDNSLDVAAGTKLKLINPNSRGAIYYTIDGTDPRKVGGGAASTARNGGDDLEITISSTTLLKARIKSSTTWSALHEILLRTDDDKSGLKVTEIHYHPMDEENISGDEYEFFELKNTSDAAIDLYDCFFASGIQYSFPSASLIYPGDFMVLASNKNEFVKRYKFEPDGEYDAQLNNGGETITLVTAASDTILSVSYNDKSPWPESPDGGGTSLVPKALNPTGDQNNPANWRASLYINGSPGRDDVVISKVESSDSGAPHHFQLYQNYPNPFNPRTTIKYYLPFPAFVNLKVYNFRGQKIRTLVHHYQLSGNHNIPWDGSTDAGGIVSNGIYFYKIKALSENQTYNNTKRMVLLK